MQPDRGLAEPGSYEKAPCGCEFWNQGEAFVFSPCDLGCPLYAYAMAESRRQGNELVAVYAG